MYESSNWTTRHGFNWGDDIDGEAAWDLIWRGCCPFDDISIVAGGAVLNDGTASSAGHVRIFELDDDAWAQLGNDIDGGAEWDQSGGSVEFIIRVLYRSRPVPFDFPIAGDLEVLGPIAFGTSIVAAKLTHGGFVR
jgi:hypothetical protein